MGLPDRQFSRLIGLVSFVAGRAFLLALDEFSIKF